jgi:hypothetical protein
MAKSPKAHPVDINPEKGPGNQHSIFQKIEFICCGPGVKIVGFARQIEEAKTKENRCQSEQNCQENHTINSTNFRGTRNPLTGTTQAIGEPRSGGWRFLTTPPRGVAIFDHPRLIETAFSIRNSGRILPARGTRSCSFLGGQGGSETPPLQGTYFTDSRRER